MSTGLPRPLRLLAKSRRLGHRRDSDDELVNAAKTVLRHVQDELLQRRGVPSLDNIEFAHARHWALHALTDRMTPAEANRIDLETTDGTPLTVCTGADLENWKYRSSRPPILLGTPVPVDLGGVKVRTLAVGCLTVFEDSTRTSARPWAFWCPYCSKRRTRLEERAARLHQRRWS